MPLTLSGNGTISDLASAPTVGGTALPTNSDLPTLSTLGIANHNNISVDSSGRLITNSQVMFHGRGRTSTVASANSAQTINVAVIETNIGSAYSSSTGRFTCPISGRYFIWWHIGHKHSSTWMGTTIRINDNDYTYQWSEVESSTAHSPQSTSIVVNLTANDYVTWEWHNSYSAPHSSYSYQRQGAYLLG